MKAYYFLILILAAALIMGFAILACDDDDDEDGVADIGDVADDDDTVPVGDDDDEVDDDDAADDDDDDVADDDDDDVTDDDDDDDMTDDDDDDDMTDDDDVTDDDDDDDAADDDDDDDTTSVLEVHVMDFGTFADLQGVTCELVDNSDGSSLVPAVTTTSDANGDCFFNLDDKTEYSYKFTLANYVTTYAFKYDSFTTWSFPLISETNRTGVYSLLSETVDPAKGTVAGAVQWTDGYSLENVGCSVVSTDTGTTVHYMESNLTPSLTRTDTNPDNGYFMTLNVSPGSYTVTATTNGQVLGADVPQVFADSMVYRNITYQAPGVPANPQPGGCTK